MIEYAKAGSEDLLCRITATNRGPDAAPLHVLPHVWYRNTWSWEDGQPRAVIEATGSGAARTTHPLSGDRWWYAQVSDKPERRTALYRQRHQLLAALQGAQPHPSMSKTVSTTVSSAASPSASITSEAASWPAMPTRSCRPAAR